MALLEWEQFLERVEHNHVLAMELADDLYRCLDARFMRLKDLMTQSDLKQVELSAHALRGLLAPYGAREILGILKDIELNAKGGLNKCLQMPAKLNELMSSFKSELAAVIPCPPGSLQNDSFVQTGLE